MLDKPLLPHRMLHAFQIAKDLLIAVRDAGISDTHLRDQAMRAAQSACLNAAESAARVTRADRARAFTIARGECVDAAAALEIAVVCGTAKQADADRVAVIANTLVAMLMRLIR
jgi:four helix bundle protein